MTHPGVLISYDSGPFLIEFLDLECRDLCLKSLSSYGNMAMVRQRCENGILTSDKVSLPTQMPTQNFLNPRNHTYS